jgi:hypothetical protein
MVRLNEHDPSSTSFVPRPQACNKVKHSAKLKFNESSISHKDTILQYTVLLPAQEAMRVIILAVEEERKPLCQQRKRKHSLASSHPTAKQISKKASESQTQECPSTVLRRAKNKESQSKRV